MRQLWAFADFLCTTVFTALFGAFVVRWFQAIVLGSLEARREAIGLLLILMVGVYVRHRVKYGWPKRSTYWKSEWPDMKPPNEKVWKP